MSNISIKFISISSGSCGNCYFISLEDDGLQLGGILIDAGVSLRRLKKELSLQGYSLDSVSAILVTHDHLDHIRHLGSLCKHLGRPVYTTPTLHHALQHHTFTEEWIDCCQKDLKEGEWNSIIGGRVSVKYFIVPHDATQTVGYALMIDGYSFVIMTDIGEMTDEALSYASSAQTVVIESNYDMQMLLSGPYTYQLKMRISKGSGHLCNDRCAEAIAGFIHDGLENIFLCHLSQNNNTPELAFLSSAKVLEDCGYIRSYEKSSLFVKQDGGKIALRVLPRERPSLLFTLR